MAASIQEIKKNLEQIPVEEIEKALEPFKEDARKGVQNLLVSFRKKYDNHCKEQERLEELLLFERECYAKGYTFVAGIDEVGRGPLAGPVVTAAVILPQNCKIEGVNDSKKLSAKKREELFDIICETAVDYAIGVISPARIDEINILQATYEAMELALHRLKTQPDFVLVDAVTIPRIGMPQKGIIKGDAKSMSIAAASILAKVTRDRMMEGFDEVYPKYGFAANKGYGSAEHIAAILEHGICPIHRRSFVKNFVKRDGMTKNNKEKGKDGEDTAVLEMQRHGYEILERNFRGEIGEIDIIAKKGTYIVFTEVKYRKNEEMGLPKEAVNWHKQQKILETAKEYIGKNGLTETDFRFDVAEIMEKDGRKFFHYIENAFWEE